jgi:predicted cytidylate kinase
MLITISGVPGSGKTTVARLLSKELGIPHIYAGDVYREQARERRISLAQLNELAEKDHTIDRELDARLAEYARAGDVVLEGRLAGFIARDEGVDALKVWLTASDRVRAERVAEREGAEAARVLQENTARHDSDAKRYKLIYGYDLDDTSIYDLSLVTDERTPEDVAHQILAAAEAHFRRPADQAARG